MLNSTSPLLSSHPPSFAQQPSSNFRPLHAGALVHYNTVIILTPRTMMFPPSPTSLGILITFHLTSLLTCLAMKIGAILVMRTFSFPLPLLVPVTQNSLLFQFGVLRTPLTLLQTTPSPFVILPTHHSRSVVPLSPWRTGIPLSPLVAQFGNAIILTLLTLRFSLTSFLVFSSAGWLFGLWKSFLSGKQLKTHSML